MIKIPAFIIGGLLILTGIAGYLLQDPGLSLEINGPLAEDTVLTLSDGNDSYELDLGFPSSDAAGEHAYWIIYNLNLNHAKDASQGNYAIDEGATDRGYVKKSFWYASSKEDTMDKLIQESENYQGVGNQEAVDIDWATVDQNSSTIRFVFKNQVQSPGPITLQSTNWKNIDISPAPKPNAKIEFKKSWTAFIPGILGIIIILLTIGAAKMPHAHKHFMHVAVSVGLVGFLAVAGKVGSAVSEMNWLKEDPYMIIHVSSLKPTTMLLSAGLLLIFVILCVVSFIEARKNRVAEEKKKPITTSSKKESSEKEDSKNDSEKKEKTSTEEDKEDSKKPLSKESESSLSTGKKEEADKKANKEDQKSKVTSSSDNQSKKDEAVKDPASKNPISKPTISGSEQVKKPIKTNGEASDKIVSDKKEIPATPPSKDPKKEPTPSPKQDEKKDNPKSSEEDKKAD
ncbi:MAG: hypothetical protein HN548_00025 [Opitutae bacterium]|nr:hypothetical protein [Opitutae bacterium]